MTLRITITEEKDSVILAPAGRIDNFSIEELQEGFEHVKETGKSNVILLLRDLEYINSRGIGVFLSFFKWMKDGGGEVRLAEVPPNIMELLDLLGLEGLAKVYATTPEAMENPGARPSTSTEEIYARLEEPVEESFVVGPGKEKNRMPYAFVGAGVVIVVILVYLFLKPANRAPGPESDLSYRLETLERTVAQIDGWGKALSQLDEKVEGLSRSMSERISQMENELVRLKAEVESAKKKAETASIPKKEEQERPKQASYHAVAKGETLYRIALQYGVTIEELRRLNNLKPNQAIFVGQRLLVKQQ
jgi:anti-sigma B factor antagonist